MNKYYRKHKLAITLVLFTLCTSAITYIINHRVWEDNFIYQTYIQPSPALDTIETPTIEQNENVKKEFPQPNAFDGHLVYIHQPKVHTNIEQAETKPKHTFDKQNRLTQTTVLWKHGQSQIIASQGTSINQWMSNQDMFDQNIAITDYCWTSSLYPYLKDIHSYFENSQYDMFIQIDYEYKSDTDKAPAFISVSSVVLSDPTYNQWVTWYNYDNQTDIDYKTLEIKEHTN